MEFNNKPTVTGRTKSVGAEDTTGNVPCFDLPGSKVTCGSHCWPNCDAHTGGSYPEHMDFNHYIVIPEARSCYIDTIDYGRFDAFLSTNSKLNVTMDTYIAKDGVCILD
jgi:hypothetical protein